MKQPVNLGRSGSHKPLRGRADYAETDNPGYAPGNHYDITRIEGQSPNTVRVTYHKVLCFASDNGVFFDLSDPAEVLATWLFLAA